MKVMTMITLALSNKLLVEDVNAQYAHFSVCSKAWMRAGLSWLGHGLVLACAGLVWTCAGLVLYVCWPGLGLCSHNLGLALCWRGLALVSALLWMHAGLVRLQLARALAGLVLRWAGLGLD